MPQNQRFSLSVSCFFFSSLAKPSTCNTHNASGAGYKCCYHSCSFIVRLTAGYKGNLNVSCFRQAVVLPDTCQQTYSKNSTCTHALEGDPNCCVCEILTVRSRLATSYSRFGLLSTSLKKVMDVILSISSSSSSSSCEISPRSCFLRERVSLVYCACELLLRWIPFNSCISYRPRHVK